MSEFTVETDEDMAAFWFHLTEDHGMSLSSLHGDPFLMHGAVSAFGLCDRKYRDDREEARDE